MIHPDSRRPACETRRKVVIPSARLGSLIVGALALLIAGAARPVASVATAAQHEQPAAPHEEPAAAREGAPAAHQPPSDLGHDAQTEHESESWTTVARLVNFAILAGTLVYLLRPPFMRYLKDRFTQIRQDLTAAREMRAAAASQLAEIDRKMRALPEELDVLKTRGAREIEVEEARIQQAADAERERLIQHTRREIDVQLQVAKRELRRHAAELAVGLASERIKRTITDEDQMRLVDRYVDQVKRAE